MGDKYEIVGGPNAAGLLRIRALRDFRWAKAGEYGGWVACKKNLSQFGDAWVSGDARVSGDAWVFGDARVSGDAWVFGDARVSGDAWVFGSARVSGSAWVFGAQISATRSDGYTFLLAWCADGQLRVLAGCRYFTLPEAHAHWMATRGGTRLGDETLAILDLLERFPPSKPVRVEEEK